MAIRHAIEEIETQANIETERTKLSAYPKAQAGHFTERVSFSIPEMREMTGLESRTIGNYAEGIGVRTPTRGKRNFRYPFADVLRVLEAIIAQSSEEKVRDQCRVSLQKLQEDRK